jgi:hypothetical protein
VVLLVGPWVVFRIGGPAAEPPSTYPTYFVLFFAAGIAAGIVFWGPAEALFHYRSPPPYFGGTPQSGAAAADALGSFGWHDSLRDRLFLERAVRDPSSQARAAVYEMLASWGDNAALTLLLDALIEEDDPRALTIGTKALVEKRDRLDTDPAWWLGEAWTWSAEHAAYDRAVRQVDGEQVLR